MRKDESFISSKNPGGVAIKEGMAALYLAITS